MNVSLTKDEFHDTMMLYFIHIARENKAQLKDPENIVFTPELDDFLRHLLSRPMGKLRTAYVREDMKTKVNFKRMVKNMGDENRDNVRLII